MGGGHAGQGRAGGGGGSIVAPGSAGSQGADAAVVAAGGCIGAGGPWELIRYSRIPWTAVTRSLMTPLICSGV
jgi:hypothetical protein